MKITADYEKIKSISNQLFGASPIQLDAKTSRRMAEKEALAALASYRRQCRAALIRKGLIKATS